MNIKYIFCFVLFHCVLGASSIVASEVYPSVDAPASNSTLAKTLSLPLLYQNSSNAWIQRVKLQGQLYTQYAYGSSQAGRIATQSLPPEQRWGNEEVRQFRLGGKIDFLKQFRLFSLFDLQPDLTPRMYRRTAELNVTWTPNDSLQCSIGKTDFRFSKEQETPLWDIVTIERSQMANILYGGQLTGAWVSGKFENRDWFYEAGVYSNERVDEFASLSEGEMFLNKLGYDLKHLSSWDKATIQLYYSHQTRPGTVSAGNPSSTHFSNAFALSNELQKGRLKILTEGFFAQGDDTQADVFGVVCVPSLFLTPKLQAVTQWQVSGSSASSGIHLPQRYEGLADPIDTGDFYASGYAGLNYYLYGHQCECLSGVKYSALRGGSRAIDTWTGLIGLRLNF